MFSNSSGLGGARTAFKRKRSIWASASGKVPSISSGFCVARTMYGRGSGNDSVETVTDSSSMASKRADWVLGVVRLIWSARTRLANRGPFWNSKVRRPCGDSMIT